MGPYTWTHDLLPHGIVRTVSLAAAAGDDDVTVIDVKGRPCLYQR